MNQNIKLIIIIIVILTTGFVYNKIRPEKKSIKLKKEMIFGTIDKNKKLNINDAQLEDYLKAGISLGIAKKIFEYKKILGRVDSLEDLSRIDGIGEKSVEKLSKNIEAGDGGTLNKLKINSAPPETLKYYGFTKKEIKKIEIYIGKNGVIYSNIEMMEILGEERYRAYENILEYN
ncbi:MULTISPECIES: ComEA family DNA-binding protein [Psychrilyobacter]|uniref:ComEA family DNA-binding protein n=1 Tax=Psychrilyobacter piezotolerans TaxID=2293438 RepID=A0ABX9KKY8_9FUSO|nr:MULTISPECIES: helix-hairpin-helix domain-containing protein [Psychrilyobacter]MCS5423059.1 helix-hairpin-helix domain-containing protein [Psychrilyobacter sp. S5]NDI76447.1 ComEA family DNA-binding protein [Psychrilyobacter piezotolerans]RDE66043.1 ComEA family DNA-binding protein [Psychrilyobacter sp. S5]REI43221.1 ComEA family DNA-binding protein [Psychrilyobacter piezotolerans]